VARCAAKWSGGAERSRAARAEDYRPERRITGQSEGLPARAEDYTDKASSAAQSRKAGRGGGGEDYRRPADSSSVPGERVERASVFGGWQRQIFPSSALNTSALLTSLNLDARLGGIR
jgi:hypothetical protein